MNLEHIVTTRLDDKLYKQLKKYADREDEGYISMSSRRAIRLFVKEQALLDQQKQVLNLNK